MSSKTEYKVAFATRCIHDTNETVYLSNFTRKLDVNESWDLSSFRHTTVSSTWIHNKCVFSLFLVFVESASPLFYLSPRVGSSGRFLAFYWDEQIWFHDSQGNIDNSSSRILSDRRGHAFATSPSWHSAVHCMVCYNSP